MRPLTSLLRRNAPARLPAIDRPRLATRAGLVPAPPLPILASRLLPTLALEPVKLPSTKVPRGRAGTADGTTTSAVDNDGTRCCARIGDASSPVGAGRSEVDPSTGAIEDMDSDEGVVGEGFATCVVWLDSPDEVDGTGMVREEMASRDEAMVEAKAAAAAPPPKASAGAREGSVVGATGAPTRIRPRRVTTVSPSSTGTVPSENCVPIGLARTPWVGVPASVRLVGPASRIKPGVPGGAPLDMSTGVGCTSWYAPSAGWKSGEASGDAMI